MTFITVIQRNNFPDGVKIILEDGIFQGIFEGNLTGNVADANLVETNKLLLNILDNLDGVDIQVESDLDMNCNNLGNVDTIDVDNIQAKGTGTEIKVNDNLVPSITQTYSLGNSTLEWDHLYARDATISRDVVIGGDLTVSGNTTTISTTDLIVEDNKVVINNPPQFIDRDAGICITRFQSVGDTGVMTGDVVKDEAFESANVQSSGTTSTIHLLNGVSGGDDYYNGWFVRITAGPNIGEVREITDFDSGTGDATVSPAFGAATSTSDIYELYPCKNIFIHWDESANKVVFSCLANVDANIQSNIPPIVDGSGNRLDLMPICAGNIQSWNVVPLGNSAYDLGSPTNRWDNLYLGSLSVVGGIDLNCSNIEEVQSLFVDDVYGKIQGDPVNVKDVLNITSSASQIRFEDGIEIGDASTSTSESLSIAIGKGSDTTATRSVALGTYTQSTGTNAIAIGSGTSTSDAANSGGTNTIAIGRNSLATANYSIAVGDTAGGTGGLGTDSVAIGRDTLINTTGKDNIGIGRSAGDTIIDGEYNITVGFGSDTSASTTDDGIAIGRNITVGIRAIAMGRNATATGTGSVALGGGSSASEGADATGAESIAIGRKSYCGGLRSVSIGFEAGAKMVGANNVALGTSALSGYTGGPYSGFQNIAIGTYSLIDITTGQNNIGIGTNTLNDNKDGDRNVAIGRNALAASVSLDQNVAIGSYALSSFTTGVGGNPFIVAIGYRAMADTTTTTNSVAVGSQALQSNISGENNVAIGTRALRRNLYGDDNVAIGLNALSLSDNAFRNIAIGRNSLSAEATDLHTHMDNVAIGYRAMEAGTLLSGNTYQNVAIGSHALEDFLNNVSNNVVVGYGAGRTDFEGNNNVCIGHEVGNDGFVGSYNVLIGAKIHDTVINRYDTVAVGYMADTSASGAVQLGRGDRSHFSVYATNATMDFRTQRISTESWIDGITELASIDGSGNFIKGGTIGNITMTSLDMNCGNIGNVQALFVDDVYGKTQGDPVNFQDVLNIASSASQIRFEDGIEIGNAATSASSGSEIVIGKGASSTTIRTIAIGYKSSVTSSNSIAMGYNASATSGGSSICIGRSAYTRGSQSIAMGYNASDTSVGASVCIGRSAYTRGSQSIAIGVRADARVTDSIALGTDADAGGDSSVAIGRFAMTTAAGDNSVAIGFRVEVYSSNAVAIGRDAEVFGTGGVAIGSYSDTSGNYAIAIGSSTDAAIRAIAIGGSAQATVNSAIAIGYKAGNIGGLGYSSIGIGRNALYNNTTNGDHNIGIGHSACDTNVTGERNICLGFSSDVNQSTDNDGIAIGYLAIAGSRGISIGKTSKGTAINTISIGYGANAYGNCDISLGLSAGSTNVNATGVDNIAIGENALTSMNDPSAQYNIGIGRNAGMAITTGSDNVFIGSGVDGVATVSNQIAIGVGATTTVQDQIAIGDSTPTSSTATATAWGQIFQNRTWDDGNTRIATINGDGDIIKGGDVTLDGDLDMFCGNIGNVQTLTVDTIIPKDGSTLTINGSIQAGNVTVATGANNSIALGDSSSTQDYAQVAIASGKFSTSGDAQTNIHTLFASQSAAGALTLLLGDGGKPTVPTDHTWCGDAYIVGRNIDTDDAYCERLFFSANDVSGTTTITIIESTSKGSGTLSDASVAISATGSSINVVVTSVGHSNTVRWVTTLMATQVG